MAVSARGRLVDDLTEETAVELANRVERMLVAMEDKTNATESPEKKHRYAAMFYGVNLYVAGWAHLRAGNNEQALRRLEESNQVTWFGRGIAQPLIAIAHHRLGRADDALRSFQKSGELLDRVLTESVEKSTGSPSIPWVDWIEFLLHHREASIVVKDHTPAIDQRIPQIEGFAEVAIGE
jgi:tetratricopeptide (TPR) repeat protein